jgi:hypothetical protein
MHLALGRTACLDVGAHVEVVVAQVQVCETIPRKKTGWNPSCEQIIPKLE